MDNKGSSAGEPGRSEDGYPLPDAAECPFCSGHDTYLISPFGSVLSCAQYYCRRCRTVFEWVKRGAGGR